MYRTADMKTSEAMILAVMNAILEFDGHCVTLAVFLDTSNVGVWEK